VILWLIVGGVFLLLWLTLELPDFQAALRSSEKIEVGTHVTSYLIMLLFSVVAGGAYIGVLALWSSDNGNAFSTAREWGYSLESDVRLVAVDPQNTVDMDVIWTDPKGIQHTEDSGYINIVQVPDDQPTRYVKRTLMARHPLLVPWSKTGPDQPMETLYVHAGQVVAK